LRQPTILSSSLRGISTVMREVGCVAFLRLAQIDNDDIALFRFDIDTIEIAVQIAAGDELQDIVIQPALGDELSRTRVAL